MWQEIKDREGRVRLQGPRRRRERTQTVDRRGGGIDRSERRGGKREEGMMDLLTEGKVDGIKDYRE